MQSIYNGDSKFIDYQKDAGGSARKNDDQNDRVHHTST